MSAQCARRALGAVAGAILAIAAGACAAATLADVKARGRLVCGVNQGLAGFSDRDAKGEWAGFDADFCRALAAAIFDDPSKVDFAPLSAAERFDALKAGRIDVLSRNSTWTFAREAGIGLLFVGVSYHDGQGFLVLRKPGVTSALDLGGAVICVQSGTTTRDNLMDFFKSNSMDYKEVIVESQAEAIKALEAGGCDVFTADQSALYAERLSLAKPGEAIVLPDVISKEPLGPAVRADDLAWFNVVRWTLFALINAEELGVASTTLAEANRSTKPAVRRFVGAEGGFGEMLGLDSDWAVRAVRAVGNYGEMFERDLGARSRFGIPRGLNQLWTNGGILYAPPLR